MPTFCISNNFCLSKRYWGLIPIYGFCTCLEGQCMGIMTLFLKCKQWCHFGQDSLPKEVHNPKTEVKNLEPGLAGSHTQNKWFNRNVLIIPWRVSKNLQKIMKIGDAYCVNVLLLFPNYLPHWLTTDHQNLKDQVTRLQHSTPSYYHCSETQLQYWLIGTVALRLKCDWIKVAF